MINPPAHAYLILSEKSFGKTMTVYALLPRLSLPELHQQLFSRLLNWTIAFENNQTELSAAKTLAA